MIEWDTSARAAVHSAKMSAWTQIFSSTLIGRLAPRTIMVVGTLGFIGAVVEYFVTHQFSEGFAGTMIAAGFGGAIGEGARQVATTEPPPAPPPAFGSEEP